MLMLPEVLTHDEVADTLRAFRQSLTKPLAGPDAHVVTVDGKNLKQFDSSALAVLLECRRMAQSQKLGFTVRSMPSKLMALATLYGLEDLMPIA